MLLAQDKAPALINYVPNSNSFAVKIKNTKDLKGILEKHPLKAIFYSEKTRDVIDDIIQSMKDGFYDGASEGEDKELTKTMMEKLFTSLNGEAYMVFYFKEEKKDVVNFDGEPDFSLVAQVDQETFKEFIKADIALEEKSPIKKVITKKEHEGIEYFSVAIEDGGAPTSFAVAINGIAVASSDEDTFKKMISAVVKKTPIENGLKSNEKMYSYLNANPNKEILVTCDFAPLFKYELTKPEAKPEVNSEDDGGDDEEIEEEIPPENENSKIFLEQMQLDKLCQINASYEHKDNIDTVDISVQCMDDGVFQFATFINNEFIPSPFISADVGSYFKLFFSMSEFKKRILNFMTKIEPESIKKYQEFLKMAKENFQFDFDAFIESIGDEYESCSSIDKDGKEEGVMVNKLKNQTNFITNFASIMNNPLVKMNLDSVFSITENKENDAHFWALATKSPELIGQDLSLAAGTYESYGFMTNPGNIAQKQIAKIKKGAENKLSALPAYNNARAMYPAKVCMFSYAGAKELYTAVKVKVIDKIMPMLDAADNGGDEYTKLIKALSEISPDDFKGNLSMAMWKEKNKFTLSMKLNSK